ncbi:hypothetical protein CCB80_11215 [Armatimonadetes bacterium Uphvl-Ar1]|nr:hypothetical protein CCB80_11215 [Armatimonadetes bacterium Uphvl-Ar1]
MPNLRRQGVPPGGPADPLLARLVSHLSQNQTVLELTTPITLVTDCPIQIAIAAPRNSASIPHHPTMCLGLITASPDTPLTIHAPKSGFRIYLSWSGLDSPSRLPTPISTGKSLARSNNHGSRAIILDPDLISPPIETIRYIPIIENAPQINSRTTPSISRIGTRLSIETLHLSESLPRTRSGDFGGGNQIETTTSKVVPPYPAGETGGQGWGDQPRFSPDSKFAPLPPGGGLRRGSPRHKQN